MKNRLNIYIPALGAMILIIVAIAWLQATSTMSPDPTDLVDRCSTCHQMEAEVHTWQEGPHAGVACTACHTEPGLWGWAHQQVAQVRMLLVARNGQQQLSEISASVPDQRCIDCHAQQMPFVMQDIAPPDLGETGTVDRTDLAPMTALPAHDLHVTGEPNLSCVDCHVNTAHGPALGTPARRDDFHQRCQNCHEEQQVKMAVNSSVSCVACHSNAGDVMPDDHRNEIVWRKTHGAASTAQTCGECHLADSAGPHARLSDPDAFSSTLVSFGVRANEPAGVTSGASPPGTQGDACLTCHGMPMPHPQNWIQDHTGEFSSDPASCANCHATKGQGFSAEVVIAPHTLSNTPACTTCHSGIPMPHPADYLADHGRDALDAGTGLCESCHSPEGSPFKPTPEHAGIGYCTDCHAQPMPHPDDFLAGHGKVALQAPASCESCHSPLNPAQSSAPHTSGAYCGTCHSDYQHPAGWISNHGTEVTEACTTCHSEQEGGTNSCADCHTGSGAWHPDMWFVLHGQAVLADGREGCLTCHTEVVIAPHTLSNTPACTTCHSGIPMPHPADYLADHGRDALDAGTGLCESCHSPEGSPFKPTPEHAGIGYCTDCHAQPMPHPDDFLAWHGKVALQAPASCESCHSPLNPAQSSAPHTSGAYCGTCHSDYQHPDGWVSDHGTEVTAACTTCHSEQEGGINSCADCHTGSGAWHPDMWFVLHGQAVLADGREGCLKCHTEVQPSCAQCHRNY